MVSRLTSSWVKERWSIARQQREVYLSTFGEAPSVREFYKRPENNPLLQRVKKYAITYEMEFKNSTENYKFFIPQETFYIYTLEENLETRNQIENNTKQALADIFETRRQKEFILENTEVRGVEREDIEYGVIDLNKLKIDKIYSTEIPKAKVTKAKLSNGKKSSEYKYNLDLWR